MTIIAFNQRQNCWDVDFFNPLFRHCDPFLPTWLVRSAPLPPNNVVPQSLWSWGINKQHWMGERGLLHNFFRENRVVLVGALIVLWKDIVPTNYVADCSFEVFVRESLVIILEHQDEARGIETRQRRLFWKQNRWKWGTVPFPCAKAIPNSDQTSTFSIFRARFPRASSWCSKIVTRLSRPNNTKLGYSRPGHFRNKDFSFQQSHYPRS